MDGRESFVVFGSALVITFVLPLVILLQPHAVKVLLQHTTILKLVVGPSLVLWAGLLLHLVEDRPLRGASSLLALDRSNEIIVEGLAFVLLCFLLLVVVLSGPPAGTLVIVG